VNKNLSKFLKNPWTIGVGTTIISVFVLKIIDKIAGTSSIKYLYIFFNQTISFFKTEYSFPLWLLILLSFSVFLFFIGYYYLKSVFINNNESGINEPDFINYTSENFNGVVYKWRYIKNYENKFSAVDYMAYCPKDNCVLINDTCPICEKYYSHVKDNIELQVLIGHRIENNLYNK
jgi:hypothetical protein